MGQAFVQCGTFVKFVYLLFSSFKGLKAARQGGYWFFSFKKNEKKKTKRKLKQLQAQLCIGFWWSNFSSWWIQDTMCYYLLPLFPASQPASAKCIFTPLNSNVILGGCCCCCRIDTYPQPHDHHQHNRPLIHGTDKLKMSVGLDLSFHILEVVIDQPKIIRRRSIILGRRSK